MKRVNSPAGLDMYRRMLGSFSVLRSRGCVLVMGSRSYLILRGGRKYVWNGFEQKMFRDSTKMCFCIMHFIGLERC